MNIDDARTKMMSEVDKTQALLGGSAWEEYASPNLPDGCDDDNRDGTTNGAYFDLKRSRIDKNLDARQTTDLVEKSWTASSYTITRKNHFADQQFALFATTPDGLGMAFSIDRGVLTVNGTTNCVPVDDYRALRDKYGALLP